MATYIARDTVGSPDSISTEDLMEKAHQLPDLDPGLSASIKERRLGWLGHAARRSGKGGGLRVVKQLVFAATCAACWTALRHVSAPQ